MLLSVVFFYEWIWSIFCLSYLPGMSQVHTYLPIMVVTGLLVCYRFCKCWVEGLAQKKSSSKELPTLKASKVNFWPEANMRYSAFTKPLSLELTQRSCFMSLDRIKPLKSYKLSTHWSLDDTRSSCDQTFVSLGKKYLEQSK